MLEVLPITGTIFALMAIGWLAGRFRLFAPQDFAVLGRFIVTLAIPALIFRAITSRPLAGLLDPAYLLAFTAAALIVFATGHWISSHLLGSPPAGSAFDAGGMVWPNSGFFGYPILLLTLPDVAGHALALNMIVENMLLIPLGLFLAERARLGQAGLRPVLTRLIRSPLLIAIAVALMVAASGVTLPAVITRPVDLLADASVAMALIVVGGNLAALGRGAMNARVVVTGLGKLIILPLLVAVLWAVMGMLGLQVDPALRAAGILMAATPVISIYAVLAVPYGQGDQAAITMLTQIILSFFTLTALLWLTGTAGQ